MPSANRRKTASKPTETRQKADGKYMDERYIRRKRRRPFWRQNNYIQLSQRTNQFLQTINYFVQNLSSQNTENLTQVLNQLLTTFEPKGGV